MSSRVRAWGQVGQRIRLTPTEEKAGLTSRALSHMLLAKPRLSACKLGADGWGRCRSLGRNPGAAGSVRRGALPDGERSCPGRDDRLPPRRAADRWLRGRGAGCWDSERRAGLAAAPQWRVSGVRLSSLITGPARYVCCLRAGRFVAARVSDCCGRSSLQTAWCWNPWPLGSRSGWSSCPSTTTVGSISSRPNVDSGKTWR
jgi:hypothetical protein